MLIVKMLVRVPCSSSNYPNSILCSVLESDFLLMQIIGRTNDKAFVSHMR